MGKGRWIIIAMLVFGAATAGVKRMEPLLDEFRHDPVVGTVVVIIILILVLVIVRVLRD